MTHKDTQDYLAFFYYIRTVLCKKGINPFFPKIEFFEGSAVYTKPYTYRKNIVSQNATIPEKIDF